MIHDVLSRYLYFPFLWKVGRPSNINAYNIYKLRERQAWLHREEIEDISLKRFKKLLSRALTTTYYKPILENLSLKTENDIQAIQSIDSVLPHLPFLTKQLIRTHREEMKIPSSKNLHLRWGGGSTGDPLQFYGDHHLTINGEAIHTLSDAMAGATLGTRIAMLWGAPLEVVPSKSLFGKVKSFFNNIRVYNSMVLSPEIMQAYHTKFVDYNPDVIISYARSIFTFALFLRERNIHPSYPRKSIITGAEVLDDYMRGVIEDVFKVPVFNRYGSRDGGCIASECEKHQGLHIHSYEVIVECLSPDTGKPVVDEPGEIIITNLSNYGQPMIRYRQGDMGIISSTPCSCGRGTPLFTKILGRTCEQLKTVEGATVHSAYFINLFYDTPQVRNYQMIQKDLSTIQLKIVKAESYGPEIEKKIAEGIKKVLGETVSIRFDYVDDIPVAASGKNRYIISELVS